MPAGIGGGLVPGSFLDADLPAALARALGEATRRQGLGRLAAARRQILRSLGPASGPRAVLDIGVHPVLDALGFDVVAVEPRPPGFVGLTGPASAPLAVIAALPWGMPAERAWRDLVRAGRVSGARWGLVGNGVSLSLVDASRPWRRGMLTCDLDVALADERAARLVWGLLRRDALAPGPDGRSVVERAIELAERGTAALCAALGDGVLEALGAVVSALGPGRRRAPADVFDESLTLVYRVLFLLFAEARGLVPTWHPVYRDGYTVAAMRRRLEARRDATGLGDAFGAMSRLAHAGCRVDGLTVTAFNGRLFSPRRTPAADSRPLPDNTVRDVVRALATTPSGAGRRPVAYADLGVEQLGAVYERVLEYEAGAAGLTRTSSARKTSGSFYTPRAITRFLVRRTLAPLVAGRNADAVLALRVVDPAMGSGAFLVAACDYLARACEEARLASGEWSAGDVTERDRAALRREVASRCLYGVDLNPMAVQLARLSIWLTTLAADRPLTFLDHHLSAGDSLVGAALADLARLPNGGRRRQGENAALPLFDTGDAGDMVAAVLPERVRLADPAETADGARQQERRLDLMNAPGSPLALWKRAADIWVAAWADPTTGRGLAGDLLARALERPAMLGARAAAPHLARAAATAGRLHPLHWELEFPEVFFDADGRRRPDGGFDAVLGNPPWEMVRADTGAAAARTAARDAHRSELAFLRGSGVYRWQGGGQVNRYQLFIERALQLARPGARIGLILPSGFLTDYGSRTLRRAVLDRTTLDTLACFDNSAGVFPIHRSIRFALLVATTGSRTGRFRARFGLTDPARLDTWADTAAEDPPDPSSVTLSRDLLARWDGAALTIPDLGSPVDLAVLDQATARAPRLADPAGWGARFGRELNATDDRSWLAGRAVLADGLPVIEGKALDPFRVDLSRSVLAIREADAARLLPREATFGRARLAYRDVAGAGNRLTVIAAILPAGTVSTHTVFCLRTPLEPDDQWCLLGLVNSLVANYLARLRVSTHVTTALMAALPVPRPRRGSRASRRLAALAATLADHGITGAPRAYAELNAIVAGLYDLPREHYAHVVSTFPLLPEALRDACVRAYELATGMRG